MDTRTFSALAAFVPLAISTSAIAQYQAPPNYQQQVPGTYQPPPASYLQQPAGGYQAPPPSYPQSQPAAPSYQQPPAYQQPQSKPAYQQPSTNYQQPPSSAGYSQQPSTNYQQPRTQPPNYSQPPTPGNYQQPSSGGYAVPTTPGYPQPANQAPAQSWSEEQIDPHHKHEDARHNHNHVYPDRGTVVRNLPASANVVNYAGQSYWFADGVWFEPRGAAYMVIEPPIGLVVASLPSFATAVSGSAGLYFYANDTYYRPRPDLGGYEVVNDPVDSAPAGSYAPAGPAGAPVLAVPASAAAMTAAVPAMAAPASAPMFGPPAGMAAPAMAQLPSRPPQMVQLSANNGQTPDQQARDRYDCYRSALAQTGFDPLHPPGGMPTAQSSQQADAYDQLRTACLQQRGYTVH
ncbi:MAG TPA: DUF6515 family protein [Steroidobacteraceae bacterium]